MKIAIIGSRTGFDERFVMDKLWEHIVKKHKNVSIISGGALGIDKFAENFAHILSHKIEIIRPINPSNKMDYLFRNVEIITKADKIIAFWDGKSRGTKFVIDYAKARNKDITVITK